MSYFEAPSSYLERVAELKGKRKNWEKNLLDKVSQELRKDGYYDFNRKIEQPEINLVPLPKRRKLNVEQFESMSPKDVALWVENINPTIMRGHRHKFLRASVTGKKLMRMSDFHLKDVGIGNRSQRKLILKHIGRVKKWTEKQEERMQKLKEKHERREEEQIAKENAEKAAKDEEFRKALEKKAEAKKKSEREAAKRAHAELLNHGRMRAPKRKRSPSRSRSASGRRSYSSSPRRSKKRSYSTSSEEDSDSSDSEEGFSC